MKARTRSVSVWLAAVALLGLMAESAVAQGRSVTATTAARFRVAAVPESRISIPVRGLEGSGEMVPKADSDLVVEESAVGGVWGDHGSGRLYLSPLEADELKVIEHAIGHRVDMVVVSTSH